ncbi:acylphosphatase [Nocardioides donggukensis]|uniref:Acylphosphatase n=1 Tax=Nocardioides donggukensis TaxID=2774019 RepID=A0A927Q0Y9_9ACTN|nr:acylphosphatase [Nocardioides donggukensis]MBD8868246.1 acylphosphatase [Nocardioides donggukensis]
MAVEVGVEGRVQGVAFRAYTQEEAERLGVSGWVRNEPDGSVLVHAEGPEEKVEALAAWCRHGPSYARVDRVSVREVPDRGETGFRIRG